MSKITCRETINDEEKAACFRIRRQVFVDEQKLFPYSDIDEYDARALHIAAFKDDKIIGTVRIYPENNGVWVGGRLAVEKRYRGKAGKQLVLKAMEIVKKHQALVFKAVVQSENVLFFENLKWQRKGRPFNYHGQSHQLMQAQLKSEE